MHSYGWFREEIQMHELQASVLNYETTNSYFKCLDRVTARYPTATTPSLLLAQLTPGDLAEMDELAGTKHMSSNIRGASVAEHIALLGFRMIDKKGGSMDEKIDHYRWIVGY
jgi:hypothetical protein